MLLTWGGGSRECDLALPGDGLTLPWASLPSYTPFLGCLVLPPDPQGLSSQTHLLRFLSIPPQCPWPDYPQSQGFAWALLLC